jgi:ribosomal protein S18 acetylase RimI-like enzyme
MTSGYPHDKKFDALRHAHKLLRDKKEYVYVARENGEIIGYISLRKDNQSGEIGFLAVTKSHQKKGIGSRLGRFIAKQARKLGCEKMKLSVLRTNWKALRLYKKFGFHPIRTVQKRKGSHIVIKLEMEKRL